MRNIDHHYTLIWEKSTGKKRLIFRPMAAAIAQRHILAAEKRDEETQEIILREARGPKIYHSDL